MTAEISLAEEIDFDAPWRAGELIMDPAELAGVWFGPEHALESVGAETIRLGLRGLYGYSGARWQIKIEQVAELAAEIMSLGCADPTNRRQVRYRLYLKGYR
jgi:hypothetical protein